MRKPYFFYIQKEDKQVRNKHPLLWSLILSRCLSEANLQIKIHLQKKKKNSGNPTMSSVKLTYTVLRIHLVCIFARCCLRLESVHSAAVVEVSAMFLPAELLVYPHMRISRKLHWIQVKAQRSALRLGLYPQFKKIFTHGLMERF